ncbi:putative intracellular protease/amidase [Enterococcus sp. PF1-24]|uniref:type 1 glutamine amidotransferase family protein n=1 Tax=unclassified Enterococcus TaxID=2608891 RepID=UPI002475E977|nr:MULTISPECIES: type 1 glutamine amidotransferase family protein [unclassified Enterococcus]MDH6364473.1 putative intracellular protease/amidase [Enterococcus sp. PFB1-1]MDH6401504.1 putative intracellular protease/amidase [Enterococcus sp. PF1-24]
MFTIYIYVLDTLADWELGHVTSELNSGRFFKKDAPQFAIKTVSFSKEPITTMGGLTITPDCLVDEMVVSEKNMLLLPGANTWHEPQHTAILKKASELLAANGTVAAICGATTALASFGLLNNRPHTSNGAGFLEMMVPDYQGQDFYIDEPAVADNNLITASSTGGLLWAKLIIEHLSVFQADTLDFWYQYFNTGAAEVFFALMQSLPANN